MDVEEYIPDLPTEDWLRVRLVVLETVREVAALLPYPLAAVMNAVAHQKQSNGSGGLVARR